MCIVLIPALITPYTPRPHMSVERRGFPRQPGSRQQVHMAIDLGTTRAVCAIEGPFDARKTIVALYSTVETDFICPTQCVGESRERRCRRYILSAGMYWEAQPTTEQTRITDKRERVAKRTDSALARTTACTAENQRQGARNARMKNECEWYTSWVAMLCK